QFTENAKKVARQGCASQQGMNYEVEVSGPASSDISPSSQAPAQVRSSNQAPVQTVSSTHCTYGEHPFQPSFGDAMVSGREDVGRRSQRGVSHRLWGIRCQGR
ncbi:unnamed protein product, partial [Ectocarpus fasciculatus]